MVSDLFIAFADTFATEVFKLKKTSITGVLFKIYVQI